MDFERAKEDAPHVGVVIGDQHRAGARWFGERTGPEQGSVGFVGRCGPLHADAAAARAVIGAAPSDDARQRGRHENAGEAQRHVDLDAGLGLNVRRDERALFADVEGVAFCRQVWPRADLSPQGAGQAGSAAALALAHASL